MIDANVTVAELIVSINNRIAERDKQNAEDRTLINLLEKQIGNGQILKTTVPKPTKVETSKSNQPSLNEPVTMAVRAFRLLEKVGNPLQQTIMRDKLADSGVDTSGKTFLTSLYTALSRKTEWFTRLDDNSWALTMWDVDALNKEIRQARQSNTVDSLFNGSDSAVAEKSEAI